jgi:hypothetical protein
MVDEKPLFGKCNSVFESNKNINDYPQNAADKLLVIQS